MQIPLVHPNCTQTQALSHDHHVCISLSDNSGLNVNPRDASFCLSQMNGAQILSLSSLSVVGLAEYFTQQLNLQIRSKKLETSKTCGILLITLNIKML
jgi:hypothetical protein